jgi:hypothetical protein
MKIHPGKERIASALGINDTDTLLTTKMEQENSTYVHDYLVFFVNMSSLGEIIYRR